MRTSETHAYSTREEVEHQHNDAGVEAKTLSHSQHQGRT
jgi:hypothetical protein